MIVLLEMAMVEQVGVLRVQCHSYLAKGGMRCTRTISIQLTHKHRTKSNLQQPSKHLHVGPASGADVEFFKWQLLRPECGSSDTGTLRPMNVQDAQRVSATHASQQSPAVLIC